MRFVLPLAPMMDPDTGSYLKPAIEVTVTGSYTPTFRSFLYPFFLIAVLKLVPHLHAITIIQHVLGLATAALIVAVILRSRNFLPQGRVLDWGTRLVAMLAASVFLFSRNTIVLEHSIRPEGVFPLFCAITILSGVEFIRLVYLEKCTGWWSTIWAVILMVFSVGNLYLKPAWGFAAGAALLPLILTCLLIPDRWLWKFGTSLIAILFTFGMIIFPGQLWKKQYGPNFFLSGTLLSAHAEILHDIFEKDALHLPFHSKERNYLLEFTRDIQFAKQNPTVHRHGFQINPDDIFYGGPLRKLRTQFPSLKDFSNFCFNYYIRAWLERPVAMATKVCGQMGFFYLPRIKSIYDEGYVFYLKRYYQESLESLLDFQYPSCPLLTDRYYKILKEIDVPEEMFLLPRAIKYVSRYLNYTFFPLLMLSIAGAIATWYFSLQGLQSATALVIYFAVRREKPR